jgi:AcrR family transcriptional regulator
LGVWVRILKVPLTGAKRKLLDAAEVLVAEKGFDLVSVRDITGAVKANVAAINYHFGSREGLMDLVMMRILEPLCGQRVSALNAQNGIPSVGEIVAAHVNSLLSAIDGTGMEKALFLRLAGRVLVLPDSALAPSLAFARREVREKYFAALAAALPDTPHKELSAAWDFFDAGIAQSLLSDHSKPEDWIAIGSRCLSGNASPAMAAQTMPETPEEEEFHVDSVDTIAPDLTEVPHTEAVPAEIEDTDTQEAESHVVAFQDTELSTAEDSESEIVDAMAESPIAEITAAEDADIITQDTKPKASKGKGKGTEENDPQELLFDF